MFLTPKEMATEYMKHIRFIRDEEQREFVSDQMQEYKAQAVKRLYKICDPSFAEAIASTIALSYMNDLPIAQEIVNHLSLNDKHLAALNNDEELMCELILEDFEQNKYAYGV